MENTCQLTEVVTARPMGLPPVFAEWNQAAKNLYRFYTVLTQTVNAGEPQPQSAAYPVASRTDQLGISDLEQVCTETIQVLNCLEVDMGNPGDFTPESTLAFLQQLGLHTIRMQKQTSRIKQVLGLNDPQNQETVHRQKSGGLSVRLDLHPSAN